MGNPRQRRKQRSGTHRPVHHSRRAKKLLMKQPPIKGPKALKDAWDRHKTVRQNYEALGLVASLNPIASGGAERGLQLTGRSTDAVTPEVSTSQKIAFEQRRDFIPKGYGRIIRDENGNIVDVEMPDEESVVEEAPEQKLVEDIPNPASNEELAGWVALGRALPRTSETSVVQKLEELQTTPKPISRFTSTGEFKTLQKLVTKYGEDVDAMARDRKLNSDQRTAGDLHRTIRKAGGFSVFTLDS